jgi:hypothetical protein
MHNTFQDHSGKEPKASREEHERAMDMLIDLQDRAKLKQQSHATKRILHFMFFVEKGQDHMVTNLMNRRKPMHIGHSHEHGP